MASRPHKRGEKTRRRRTPMRRTTAAALTASMTVAALGTAGFTAFAYRFHQVAVTANAAAWHDSDEIDARRNAAKAAEREQVDQQLQIQQQALKAGMIFAPGSNNSDGTGFDVFYRFEDDGTCTIVAACSWISVTSTRDCPNGVYVAANITHQGTVIASGNKITGALHAGQPATFRLDYPDGPTANTGSAELTNAHCL